MRILVTGGAGYLGCHLCSLLLDMGYEVRIYERFCFGETPLAPIATRPGCEVVRGDIRRLQEHPGLLDGVDAIAHLAGLSNDPSCALDEDMAEDVNVESAKELGHMALQRGVGRFVYTSTCGVYGHAAFSMLDEASPASPVSPYGQTNLRAEEALTRLSRDGLDLAVARLATLYGWSPRMRFDLAVNQMTATALRTGRVNILGGGGQWRPFMHVRDAARAIALLLTAPPEAVRGQVFNVGDPAGNHRISDLAKRIASLFGDPPLDVARDDDDIRSFRVDFSKLAALGFHPVKTLEDGVADIREGLADPAIDPNADIYFNVRTLRRLLHTPSIEGGEPMAPRLIPLYKPTLGLEEEEAVVQTLRSGWLTSAARVPAFEKMFAETVGAKEAVAVTSCTAALHLSLVEAGVKPGDEVITSPITFGSTANTIVNMGATPVFVDIEPGTLNMDPAVLEAAITQRTRAIMPVHLAGLPCELDKIRAICAKHEVRMIEDAAHGLGASYKGAPIGAYSDYTCFSFYAIKNITTIEGGAITLSDPDKAAWLRQMATHGMGHTAWDRYGRSAAVIPSEVLAPGYKYRLHDVSAAIGIQQLKRFPSLKAARLRLARMYQDVLSDIDEITVPHAGHAGGHAWHLMIIRLKLDLLSKRRDDIREDLRRENVQTGLHFYGVHLHQYYQDRYGFKPESLPEATAASMDMISLPLYPLMEDKHVQQVADALKKVLSHARR